MLIYPGANFKFRRCLFKLSSIAETYYKNQFIGSTTFTGGDKPDIMLNYIPIECIDIDGAYFSIKKEFSYGTIDAVDEDTNAVGILFLGTMVWMKSYLITTNIP